MESLILLVLARVSFCLVWAVGTKLLRHTLSLQPFNSLWLSRPVLLQAFLLQYYLYHTHSNSNFCRPTTKRGHTVIEFKFLLLIDDPQLQQHNLGLASPITHTHTHTTCTCPCAYTHNTHTRTHARTSTHSYTHSILLKRQWLSYTWNVNTQTLKTKKCVSMSEFLTWLSDPFQLESPQILFPTN